VEDIFYGEKMGRMCRWALLSNCTEISGLMLAEALTKLEACA
jgi:hypothetical protein